MPGVELIKFYLLYNNSSTSFCLRSSSCRTNLSIYFQPSWPTTIWMFFFSYPCAVFSSFYYETDHRKCEMMLGGWHCCLRLLKLGRPFHTGFEPRSLAWLACSTGQSATTYTIVEVLTPPWRCLHHRGGSLLVVHYFCGDFNPPRRVTDQSCEFTNARWQNIFGL